MFTSPAGAVAKCCDEYVCLCVCLFVPGISPEPHARPVPFLCMFPMSVVRSSCGMLMISRIAYRREWGDGSAQRGRSVIYDCLVFVSNSEYSRYDLNVMLLYCCSPSALHLIQRIKWTRPCMSKTLAVLRINVLLDMRADHTIEQQTYMYC